MYQFNTTKQRWLIIAIAITMSVVVYGFLVNFNGMGLRSPTMQKPNPDAYKQMLPYCTIAGFIALLIACKIAVKEHSIDNFQKVLLSPSKYQSNSIIAFAFSEACTIFGLLLFFIGAPSSYFYLFAAGTLIVNLFVIIPCGLKYWAKHDQQS